MAIDTKKLKKISKVYDILFKDIEHSNDLEKYGLTLVEFKEARFCFITIKYIYKTKTLYSGVAEFYKKHGFNIKQDGICFEIAC